MDIVTFFGRSLSLISNLLQLKYGTNMFQQHPIIAGIAVISLIMYCFVRWFKLKYPGHYEKYFGSVPFVVNLLGFLSMACTMSLLLPDYVRPLVFIFCLLLPLKKALYWILMKLEEHFGETEFWITRVDPALCYLRRRVNRARRNLLLAF
ncbi:hypothetical protein KY290_033054 [Solanum tuberosum]|uniref:Bicarbonate transporter-like transmembrane domain-containing protein n=1 Tax=Solanum tuberosum TaxID=4113 RepID=A0ABQ7U0Z1_SOLTU|nr:hypothetical protein KY290_033054 [Solanum tuberosum]